MKKKRPLPSWVDPVAQAAYELRTRGMRMRLGLPPLDAIHSPAVSKPKLAPQVDHAAHLEARLAKSFQRQALAAATAGATAMASPITNDDRKNAWAKAFGGKRPAPSSSASSAADDPRRAAWKRAMQRPSAGVEGATGDGGKAVDRAAAWKRAMKSPRD